MKLIETFRNIIFIMRYKGPVVCEECGGVLSRNNHFERRTGFHERCVEAYHQRKGDYVCICIGGADRNNIISTIGAACGFLRKVAQGHFSEERDALRAREISRTLQDVISLLGAEGYSEEDAPSSIKRVLEL